MQALVCSNIYIYTLHLSHNSLQYWCKWLEIVVGKTGSQIKGMPNDVETQAGHSSAIQFKIGYPPTSYMCSYRNTSVQPHTNPQQRAQHGHHINSIYFGHTCVT